MTKCPSIRDCLINYGSFIQLSTMQMYVTEGSLLPMCNDLQDILLNEETIHQILYPIPV